MDVYGEQSWWNFSCDLYISLFDGRPKRHRSDLQMSLWMEILSREKLHLLIYFVLFLTTLRMCYRSIKGILGSCESLCLLFIMLFNFFLVSFVVGSLWVVLRSSSIIWRSLWVVVGFCDYHKHIPPNRVHIIQIPSAAPSFMGIWAIWNPLNRGGSRNFWKGGCTLLK